MDGVKSGYPAKTADPSTALLRSSGRDDKGEGWLLLGRLATWMDRVMSCYSAKTADPSTALLRSFGRDDKGRVGYCSGDGRLGWRGLRVAARRRLQIPPLRSFGAPVGMTRGELVTAREMGDLDGRG
jgi:hypothetical protein